MRNARAQPLDHRCGGWQGLEEQLGLNLGLLDTSLAASVPQAGSAICSRLSESVTICSEDLFHKLGETGDGLLATALFMWNYFSWH